MQFLLGIIIYKILFSSPFHTATQICVIVSLCGTHINMYIWFCVWLSGIKLSEIKACLSFISLSDIPFSTWNKMICHGYNNANNGGNANWEDKSIFHISSIITINTTNGNMFLFHLMNVRAWIFRVLPAYKMVKAKIKQVESSHSETLKQSFYTYTSLFKVEW